MNPLLKTETGHQYPGDQTATDRVCHSDTRQQPHSASDHAGLHGYQSGVRSAAAENIHDESASARAQQIRMRDETLILRGLPSFSRVDAALHRLTRHIDKSIPWQFRASTAILPRFWFLVHHTVAVSVLRQVHQQVRRLGLTRVADTTGFLAEHCRWYGWFCSFSSCVTRVLQ